MSSRWNLMRRRRLGVLSGLCSCCVDSSISSEMLEDTRSTWIETYDRIMYLFLQMNTASICLSIYQSTYSSNYLYFYLSILSIPAYIYMLKLLSINMTIYSSMNHRSI